MGKPRLLDQGLNLYEGHAKYVRVISVERKMTGSRSLAISLRVLLRLNPNLEASESLNIQKFRWGTYRTRS